MLVSTVALIMAEMKFQSFLFSLQKERNITVIFLQKVSSCMKQFPINSNVHAIGLAMHKIISNWCEFNQTITMGDFYVWVFRWFKFTLRLPYSIAPDKLRLAIWDTSFLAELFRGMLFKWKGANTKSHQKWDFIVNLGLWLVEKRVTWPFSRE